MVDDEQIGDDHPGEILEVVEVAPDGRQRARHDGLVQRLQEAAEHQPVEDEADLGMGQARRVRRDGFGIGGGFGALLQGTHGRWLDGRRNGGESEH